MRLSLIPAASLALLLAGCGAVTPTDSGPERVDTKVDTPALRKEKKDAGIIPCRPPADGSAAGQGMPKVTLPCFGGGKDIDVSHLRGPMVINLWASWCGPCRDELPVYQQFHEKFGDKVQVLGVNYNDQMPEAAMDLLADTGATYPELADPNTDLAYQDPLPNFQGLPAIIFVDEDGAIVDGNGNTRVMFEEIDSLSELTRLVEKNLDVKL
ncbi:MAG: TlpA family protein disulfide reductase [Nocardioides sp.]|nr:TlpA family protein disulfide reductase [Nocardioides sp.]